MYEYRLISVLLILFCTSLEVLSNNFRGGIIMVRPKVGGESKEMEISYHVSWEQDTSIECNASAIENSYLLDGEDSIDCLYGCSGTITRMSYTCTCYSAEDNWSFGENQLTYVFNSTIDDNTVTIGSIGGFWSSEVNGTWNISTTFSLATRNDTGQINSSPRAATVPLLRLQEGCKHIIPLAVSDPDNDTVQCRWAEGRECGDICNKLPGAFLNPDTCTIEYHANYGAGIKAFAIMIEDYGPKLSNPLSSVALQFLVLVFSSTEPCPVNIGYFKPSVSVHSSSNLIIKSYGESIDLKLTCVGNEASSYYWEKENGYIQVGAIGVNASNLTFIDVQPEDSGNYRCVVTSNCNVISYSDYTAITIIEDDCNSTSDYYLGFFYNYNGGSLSLLLTTTESQPVSYFIEAPSQLFRNSGTVAAKSSVVVNLPSSLQTSSYYHWNYGIYLKASSDKITVIGQSYNSHTSDTYLALPTIDLKTTEYIYYGMSVYDSSYYSVILIVGTEDSTTVKLITTRTTYVATGSNSYYRTRVYSGSQYSFTINRLQTMYIADSYDLSGTKIVTNKPVSVFSGHQCAEVPNGYGSCGYLIEQIPPTTFWDNLYYIAPLATRRSYTIKVLAAYDNTYVRISCNGTTLTSYYLSERGHNTRTLDSQQYCRVYAYKNVLVAQFSGKNGEDPSMTLVPATNNFASRFQFSTFHPGGYPSYINIVVMAQYYQPDSIYLITGNFKTSLKAHEWTPIRVNYITEAYATKVPVLHSAVEIIHTEITALMTVIVYGVSQRNGYTHPGGFSGTMGKLSVGLSQLPLHSVELTDTVNIKCSAIGYGITYQWAIGSGSFPSKIIGINSNTLIIPDVRSSDENSYTCVASTYRGCALSNTTQLIVTGVPVVNVTPSVPTVEITLTTKLTATVTGIGPFTYQWEKGDQILTDETRETYIVHNASQEDENYYRCLVTNNFGDFVVSNSVWLQVTRNPPYFTKHPTSKVINLKSNFTNISLTCEADGALAYRWERQYDTIPSNAIGVNTNTLTLINLQIQDAGQYRCLATNDSGTTESDYAVLFLRASSSTIVTHPVDTSAAAPFGGVFTCSVYGYGHQYITWHKKSGTLPYKHKIKWTATSRIVTSTLFIPNVTEQDAGKYFCQAWANNLGTQSEQADLYYLGIGIAPKPVVEMTPGHLIKLTVNNFKLLMKCTSYADGFDYKWEKKNERNISRAQDITSRQLTIANLKPEDSGEYRCIISNSTGVIMSDYSLLTVKVALPVITRQPSSTVVQVFSIGSFECIARSYGDVSITWKRMNSQLPESVNISESKSLNEITSVLSLENVGYYKGYYYCVIKNSAGLVNSTLAHYGVAVPCPEIILQPEPVKVLPDATVTFSCVAWSYSGLLYEWNKNDSLTLPYNSTVSYEDKSLLLNSINTTVYEITVFNAQETDEGHYCCIASNDCGSTTKCAWLEVDTSPVITLQPTSRTFKYSMRNISVFEIVATGVGLMDYLWQKFDASTDSWIPLSNRAINASSPNLNYNMITEEDQGMYHCIVTNYDGSVTSDNVTITVFAATTITYYSPTIVAFEGNKVDLMCNATNDEDATDTVQVSWYYGATLIKPDGEYIMINDERNNDTGEVVSILSFDSVNYTNDGVYTCRASNDPLSFTENNIQLTVEYPPRVILNPPGPTYAVSVGTRLFLYCIAKGLPTPTIQWYENNILIAQQSSPLYLALTNMPKSTLYTCEAKNNAGNMENTARESITVVVKKTACPSLSDPNNGKVFQFSDGNTVIFSCNDGYTKKGNSFLHCINGNWSSLPPTCLKLP